MNIDTKHRGEIVIYRTEDGKATFEVKLEEQTVWLTQAQMAKLFQTTKQNVSLHIQNLFGENELEQKSTVKESLTVRREGGREVARKLEHYNLDVIISVGYRVKSKRGTQFRIWATNVLRDHLVKGYTLNRKALLRTRISDITHNFSYGLRTC
jgi:hypothetical protein